ncbi:hypothetical protein FRB98_002119, partial [Tulasnella sp. 332]
KNKRCVLRSAFYPDVTLDLFKGGSTPGNLVLVNTASGEDSQTWTLIKGGKGFRLKNLMVPDTLGFAQVKNIPSPTSMSVQAATLSVKLHLVITSAAVFKPLKGALPEGQYLIQWSNMPTSYALNLTSVASIHAQLEFKYGTNGYTVRNVANTYLTYSPWAVPGRTLNTSGFIVGADESTVEWALVQSPENLPLRYFYLRLVSGLNLQPTDISLSGLASGTPFYFRPVGTSDALISPFTSFTPATDRKCVIRSAFYPEVALDLFKGGSTTGNLVLINNVGGEDSQTWALTKGGKGFRLKNLMVQDSLGFAPVAGTPVASFNSVVCQDDKAVEWLFVRSSHGTEHVYLVQLSKIGNADTGHQWVIAEPKAKDAELEG